MLTTDLEKTVDEFVSTINSYATKETVRQVKASIDRHLHAYEGLNDVEIYIEVDNTRIQWYYCIGEKIIIVDWTAKIAFTPIGPEVFGIGYNKDKDVYIGNDRQWYDSIITALGTGFFEFYENDTRAIVDSLTVIYEVVKLLSSSDNINRERSEHIMTYVVNTLYSYGIYDTKGCLYEGDVTNLANEFMEMMNTEELKDAIDIADGRY